MTTPLVQIDNTKLEALYEAEFVGYSPDSYHGKVLYFNYDSDAFADLVLKTHSRVNTAPYSQEKYDSGFYMTKEDAYEIIRDEHGEDISTSISNELEVDDPDERYLQQKQVADAYEKQQAEGRLNTTDGPEEQIFYDYIEDSEFSYYISLHEREQLNSIQQTFDRWLGVAFNEETRKEELIDGTEPIEFFLKWVTFFNRTIASLKEKKVSKSSDLVLLSPELRTTVETLLRALDEYNQKMSHAHEPFNFPQFDLVKTPLRMLELGYSAITFERGEVERELSTGGTVTVEEWAPIVLKHSEYMKLADNDFKSMPSEWQIEVLKKISK
ncbi:hypothetical protein [Nesterenkonia alba]|uniref:hypothetical protein n=1 Tax=Nesterenkonia alba TaxID=515814 RepID=UPI0003B62A84|nr:hypothetical protein [Nesterenkonia alba]